MDVGALAKVVDNMVLQHDYPGFEPRSLKLGLPEEMLRGSAKVFAEALGHESIYVKLAALRWFQERPGLAKSHLSAIAGLLDHNDEWVRQESVRALERVRGLSADAAIMIADRLEDPDVEVKKAAAKALGKIFKSTKLNRDEVVAKLKKAEMDEDRGVRWKVQKTLRQLGEYTG